MFFPVTYPLDLTKTRLQIQGEIANRKNGKSDPVSIYHLTIPNLN